MNKREWIPATLWIIAYIACAEIFQQTIRKILLKLRKQYSLKISTRINQKPPSIFDQAIHVIDDTACNNHDSWKDLVD